jgi:hypothetical protein
MFTGFDFGKSLLKQVEAFRRLPPAQQPRREAALVHQIEVYTKAFLRVLGSPGSANPGLLKNAAEALLEAALAAKESRVSYSAFAEMVARSRKVPVVPGLAGLIDKLLELPTEMKPERVSMLNWRIATGSLRPEKYLAYLSERAQLTGDAADWKDYAYWLGQLIKKGTLKLGDDAAFTALDQLAANKGLLGDRATGVQLMLAESQIERRNYRQAEQVLIGLAAEPKQLPEDYPQVVIALLDAKPDASWELHQAGLAYLLAAYTEGRVAWSQLLSRVERTSAYTANLVDYLLNYAAMPKDEKLSTLVAERIMSLDARQAQQYLERWRIVLAKARVKPSEEALEAIERRGKRAEAQAALATAVPVAEPVVPDAVEPEASLPGKPEEATPEVEAEIVEIATPVETVLAEDEQLGEAEAEETHEEPVDVMPEAVAEPPEEPSPEPSAQDKEAPAPVQAQEEVAPAPAPAEAAVASLADCANVEELRSALQGMAADGMSEGKLAELSRLLGALELTDWQVTEGRLWLAGELVSNGAVDAAAEQLAALPVPGPAEAGEVSARVRALFADISPPVPVQALLGHLALAGQDYPSALSAALALPEHEPARGGLLAQLQERILESSAPNAASLMILAQANRASVHDPLAGFEVATTASLLAPDIAAIQEAYSTWAALAPPEQLHRQRAQQAAYLCAHHQSPELLDVALAEIEALDLPEGAHDAAALEWLEQLRPELERVEAGQFAAARLRWTRLYLKQMVRASQREELPELFSATTEQLPPEEALSLVQELAGVLSESTLRVLECETYLRQGAWEQALDAALGGEVASVVPIQRLCERLPEEALLPAGQRLTQALIERGDDAGKLELVRYLGQRLGGNGESEQAHDLRGSLDQVLTELCEREYEPAVRYRLEQRVAGGDLMAVAADLLSLARQDDAQALERLEDIFSKLLADEAPAALLMEIADVLAQAEPRLAIAVYARTGLATERADWALERLAGLQVTADSVEEARLLGELALSAPDEQRLMEAVEQLRGLQAHEDALELVEAALAEYPDSDLMHIALIRLQLEGETRDLPQATSNLLKLAQLYHERGIRPREALDPLKPAVADAYARDPGDQEAQHLRLTMLALGGELQEAAKLVQQIMLRGPQAADGLLSLFERLAMEDTDLPSPMLIAWGRALFRAGRVNDALNRLSGLRDAVSDYPEYTELLEEIRAAGGGPGASMQLGEAYLRVHLWQRSAEEYAAALALDPGLAEPVLTQLRHHAALDPNPMKYPLHLLGLRAVAGSDRQADWGWALSAMTWLLSRWSAEELYGLAARLWEQHQRVELEPSQREELLLHLLRLANKLSRIEEAVRYLSFAWQAAETPGPELLGALRELDESKLPESSPLHVALRKYQAQAAMLTGPALAVIEAAHKLASISPEGRVAALQLLADYQLRAEHAMPVLLARLRLLDLGNTEERETFVRELLDAAASGLPQEQVRSLINTVLELIRESVDSSELAQLLMLLFRQLGDQARAWLLALSYILGDAPPVPTAIETLASVAADEFAVRQRVVLAEVHLVRGEYDQACTALEQLSWSNLGEHAGAAVAQAEALLATPAAAAARRWLIGHYRDAGSGSLAADHLVWAHACANPQPAEWLNEQRNADLLYRAAQLQELQGNADAARRVYQRALDAPAADGQIAASIRWRLSELEEAAGRLEQAHGLCAQVLALIPGYAPAQERLDRLSRAITQQQIADVRGQQDAPERTVRVVQLLRGIGEINEAIAELQGAVGRGQSAPEVYVELAECFLETGEHTIARRAYLEVLKRLEQGGDVELKLRALYGLATAEEAQGDNAEAAKYLEELLLMRRDYRDAKERLTRLQAKLKRGGRPAAGGKAAWLADEILSLLGLADEDNGERSGK